MEIKQTIKEDKITLEYLIDKTKKNIEDTPMLLNDLVVLQSYLSILDNAKRVIEIIEEDEAERE